MYKTINKAVLVLIIMSVISCSDSINSGTEQLTAQQFDQEIMDSMTSALLSLEDDETVVNETDGHGIFVLNWNGLKSRFSNEDQEDKLGMATAIGFEDESPLRPPYDVSTIDMGSVTIYSPDGDAIELSKGQSRFSGENVIYSFRSFGPFQETESLKYKSAGEYTIRTSGSNVFPSLNLTAMTPSKQVSILSPSDETVQGHSGDLELTWDATSGKPVAILIRPGFNPREGQKPGEFNRDNTEMILLEDQNGSYTISGDILSEIANNADANELNISVGQLHVEDFEVDGRIYRVIMRTGDHRLVELN